MCCLSNCPLLLSDRYVYSSDDDIPRKLSSYTERFSRRVSLKEFDNQCVRNILFEIFFYMKNSLF